MNLRRYLTELLAIAIAAAFVVVLVWSALVDAPPLCPRGPRDFEPCTEAPDSPRP